MSENPETAPDCFGTGDYSCGSEVCDWCSWSNECCGLYLEAMNRTVNDV